MKAVVENLRSGEVEVVEVPQPELRPNGILVRTAFSAVSAGTERAKLETGRRSLLGKALARPDLVRQVVAIAREQGPFAAYQKVQARLQSLSALGYSGAGIVIAVGKDVSGFEVGNRVACAGVGYANHAEVNFVPQNLAVRVPDGVPLDAASLTTVGAIALHSFRQSRARIGESVAIVGAGLVGLLTLQIARAAGCRTLVVDVDPQRAEMARKMGCDEAFVSDAASSDSASARPFEGTFDVAIITAASPSNGPVELAGKLLRDRGQIVVVGDVSLDLSRRLAYEKELGLVLSRSYGPGRYDPQYEEQGIDYPASYVRWTENRNMQAFLAILENSAINVSPLIATRFPVERAVEAYQLIRDRKTYTAILSYPVVESLRDSSTPRNIENATAAVPQRNRAMSGPLRVSCIGVGAFARDVILPFLRGDKGIRLVEVASASGMTAESARRNFGFDKACGVDQILDESAPDLLLILTRHDTHAGYALRALHRGIPVFVEKPLATHGGELQGLKQAYIEESSEAGRPFLMVDFNRRFAPHTERIGEFFSNRKEPMLVHIRVNAGYLPPAHWTHEHGGRVVGELCHFVDWARAVIGSPIQSVKASALPDGARYRHDNVAATLSFEDGSLANILYLADGDRAVPKEYFEVFSAGRVAQLEDFRILSLSAGGKTKRLKSLRDKGHKRLLDATINALRAGGDAPIPFSQLVEVTEATFAILASIQTSAPGEPSGSTAELQTVSLL